jgi:flagellar basal body-associated protein FliL
MENQQTQDPIITTERPKKRRGMLLSLIACLVLLVAGVGGVYYWQYSKLKTANNDLASANSQNTKLSSDLSTDKKQISTLSNQYNQAKATIDSYQAAAKSSQSSQTTIATQADLSLVVNGAEYVNPAGTVTQGGQWFGVNITLTNNTSNTISIQDSDFYLKDSQSNSYPEETITGAGSTLPTGWVGLAGGTLDPGQSVRGTVEFQMPNETVKNFSFINVTNSYSVDSSN